MSTAADHPPPIETKRSRRHGVINLPAPDVPPSPTLPPLPPKSPLRARARSSADSTSLAAAFIATDPTSSQAMRFVPQHSASLSVETARGPPGFLDVGISSSPLAISASTFGQASTSTTSLSPNTPSSVGTSSGTSKRTHALRELLDTERAYASDLALVRDVYVRLARDPMAPFAAAPLPTGPPTPKAKPLKNRTRASTGGRPKTSAGITTPPMASPPFASRSTSSSTLSPAALLPSLKRKTSTPSLARQATTPERLPSKPKQPLSEHDIAAIFLNIDKLATLSEELCKLLHIAIHGDPAQEGFAVGGMMMEYIPRMLPHYKVYIAKHDAAASHLHAITPHISSYLSTARVIISPLTNAWDLPSLLIKPVQRILKYPLLLSAIADATPGEMPGSMQLREAKRAAEAACTEVNEAKRNWEEVGVVLRNARQRKLGISTAPLPSRAALSPELQAWDERLEAIERSMRRLASDARDWIKRYRAAMEKLVLWADANERTMKVGMREGESHDGRGRWCRSAVEEILGGVWRTTDERIHRELIPNLAKLLSIISAPRLLLQALRTSLSESAATAVAFQLQADLPHLLQLTSRAYTRCIRTFTAWQREFWEGVRVAWGKALGEEDGEWLEDLEGRLQEDTVVVDPAILEQIQMATPALLRNNHFVLPPREMPSPPVPATPPVIGSRPRSMDAADLTAQLYGLHLAPGEEHILKPSMGSRTITFDDGPFSRGSLHSGSASSTRQSTDMFYRQPSTQSSSSELLPPFAHADRVASTPSLELRRRSMASSLSQSEQADDSLGEHSVLHGLPLDEALRSVGVQEIDIGDDVQAQWAGLYEERKVVPYEEFHTPPESPDRSETMSVAAAKGPKRVKSTASNRSLTRIFGRSRATTPEGSQTPPMPEPTPPMPNVQLPWASSYAYQSPFLPTDQPELAHYNFYPMPQKPNEPQPQPMLAHQVSVKEKVLAHREHARQASGGSASTSNPGSSRRSSAGTVASPSGSALGFNPPPQPRRVHFLASPITAFHLPTPRYSTAPYTFHGLPFLTLRVGDIITVTQECGRPTDYRDFPLWTDGQEDRLLVGRAEGGHEGWVLASFVLPISA